MDEHDALNNVFGRQLALFRKERQVSQLSLSLDADVSTRHISFLETGRSAPRREMIARLSAALGLCHGEHQSLMRAATIGNGPRHRATLQQH
ncbi:helix-turn-helix domain-containing protein [Sulfitobacter porphyrae]|uniref:Helix-turn-helix domain-containing protein n=1 Tax=Sulfitobacter porphyrae TaxID=1246864 RepID=A0ABW2B215_9RHOB